MELCKSENVETNTKVNDRISGNGTCALEGVLAHVKKLISVLCHAQNRLLLLARRKKKPGGERRKVYINLSDNQLIPITHQQNVKISRVIMAAKQAAEKLISSHKVAVFSKTWCPCK